MIMDQSPSGKSRTLKRLQVGGLPLIHAIAERMRLKEILVISQTIYRVQSALICYDGNI